MTIISLEAGVKRVHSVSELASIELKRRCKTNDDDGKPSLLTACQTGTVTLDDIRNANLLDFDEIDSRGRSPLFHAIMNDCSFEVVKALFVARTDAMTKSDHCWQYPLHLLYEKYDIESLREILDIQSSLALFNSGTFSGQRLYERMFDSWYLVDDKTEKERKIRLNKAVLTLQAAHRVKFGKDGLSEIQIAMEMGLSANILTHFVRTYPEQLVLPIQSNTNMLPIHYALMNMHRDSGLKGLIGEMIALEPSLCEQQFRGEYPLHIAIKRGLSWGKGIRELLMMSNDALHKRDPTTRLLPSQLAGRHCDLDTIFCVLRERPILK